MVPMGAHLKYVVFICIRRYWIHVYKKALSPKVNKRLLSNEIFERFLICHTYYHYLVLYQRGIHALSIIRLCLLFDMAVTATGDTTHVNDEH